MFSLFFRCILKWMKTDAQANYTTIVHRFISISVCNEKNNENIPYNLITNKKYICKENALLL